MDRSNQQNLSAIFRGSLIVYGAFIGCAAIGMLLNPEAFHKFFSATELVRAIPPQLPDKSYYWDVKHYAELALNSQCSAFYPLWPWLIRVLFHPRTIDQAAHYFSIGSTLLFLVSIPLLLALLNQCLRQAHLALLITLLYTLNPMAIFRVIGYTESLFSILSVILIYLLLISKSFNEVLKLGFVAVTIALMSLNRPALLQLIFASGATLATLWIFDLRWESNLLAQQSSALTLNPSPKEGEGFSSLFPLSDSGRRGWGMRAVRHEIKLTFTIWVGALLGYLPYGLFCLSSRGDFLAPFVEQKNWGKQLGIHLELLLFPKSPLFDLWGLYFPVLILFMAVLIVYYQNKQQDIPIVVPKFPIWPTLALYPPILVLSSLLTSIRAKTKGLKLTKLTDSDSANQLGKSYPFWFCLYFCVSLAAIVFLTQDRLFSLARFIFAIPFFFIAFGYLCRCFPSRKVYQTLYWFIFVSSIALIQQWVSYGRDEWLG